MYMGAIEIITRRANPDDVIAGEMIGAFFSYFAFQNMKLNIFIDNVNNKIQEESSIVPVNMYT